MFTNILLEQQQKDLLVTVVEASRNVPQDQRKKFLVIGTPNGDLLHHAGLPADQKHIFHGDVEILASQGLVIITYGTRGSPNFQVTPLGYKYYEFLKGQSEKPIQNIEMVVKSYLDSSHFKQSFPLAHSKWAEAETILWATDSDAQLTTIGHLCREAMQEFVTVLVERYKPSDVTSDKAHTVARLKAVIKILGPQLGSAGEPFLEALISYWGSVNDLVQRQEHGGQKEGAPLIWIDARRVVFQTAVVMFEIDSALSHLH